MADSIDDPVRRFRVELDGGAVVEPDEGPLAVGEALPVVAIRLPAARAHSLAHLLADWAAAFRLVPDRGDKPSTYALSRAIEDVAAALGERGAVVCASRARGSVPAEQRLAAVAVLRDREPALSPLQRIAVIDAAARWMDEDTGDELAYALLSAACSSDVATSQAYVELLTPASNTGTNNEEVWG